MKFGFNEETFPLAFLMQAKDLAKHTLLQRLLTCDISSYTVDIDSYDINSPEINYILKFWINILLPQRSVNQLQGNKITLRYDKARDHTII